MTKQKGFYQTLSVLWMGHFLVDLMIGIWPVYKTMVGLDLAIAGLIAGCCAFAGEGLQLFFGHLSDRGYTKYLILVGLIATLSSTCLAFTTSYFYLSILFLLTCIGSGAFHPSAVSVVSNLSKDRKGLLIAFFATGGALGMGLSQLVFSKSYALMEGNTLWLMIPTLLLLVFMILFYQLPVRSDAKQSHEKFSLEKVRKFFRSRELTYLYFNQIFNQSVFWGTIFLLPDILLSKGYESWISYGGGHFCLIAGGGAMMVPAGYLADRYSARSVLLVSLLIGGVAYYAFLMAPLMSPTLLLLNIFVIGAALGLANPVGVALGNQLLPNEPGIASGMLMGMVWCFAEFIGQGGGGLVSKMFVENPATKAAAVVGIGLILSAYCAAQLPIRMESEEPEFAV